MGLISRVSSRTYRNCHIMEDSSQNDSSGNEIGERTSTPLQNEEDDTQSTDGAPDQIARVTTTPAALHHHHHNRRQANRSFNAAMMSDDTESTADDGYGDENRAQAASTSTTKEPQEQQQILDPAG